MDYSECHKEQIHNPEHIQSFGYLIGLDYKTRSIEFYSENLSEIFDIEEEELLNTSFSHFYDVFYEIIESKIYSELTGKVDEGRKLIGEITINRKKYHLTIFKHEKYLFIEIEQFTASVLKNVDIFHSIENTKIFDDEISVWQDLTQNIFRITQYDRVMVYQFLEDGSGKVIAETKNDNFDSYLNLYYPESDIPKQARELYLKSTKRIFSNIYSIPCKIISARQEKLDLTYSSFRAMSPIHAVYLKNAGVASSFSISIIIKNKLWGLITCQNVEVKHIDLYSRIQAGVFTILATNSAELINDKTRYKDNIKFEKELSALKSKFFVNQNKRKSTETYTEKFNQLLESDGIAYFNNGIWTKIGNVPSDNIVENILDWCKTNVENIFISDSFMKDFGEELNLDENSAGVCICKLDSAKNQTIIWFRKEFQNKISWAGKDEKHLEKINYYGEWRTAVSPRQSFDVFSENIKGKSLPWDKSSEEKIRKIKDLLEEYDEFINLNGDDLNPGTEITGNIDHLEEYVVKMQKLITGIKNLESNSEVYDAKKEELANLYRIMKKYS
ncbi:GAF domain-containing protein [uncultured Chryseobacterium sp.]|uniref:GAF domain-containing protein n=1 Tax=uncultured Chryseobacterium sp. TaxID=259322 RepID=UPI00262885DA|nr:GAF domain-containing protein [uncultured Chryseobacterium sp.]